MDGLGSPDSLMEHSMLDIKNSSPYACYSPKLSYEVFPTNRGKQWNISKDENYNNPRLQDLISEELKTRLSGISTKTTPATVDLQVTMAWPTLTSPLTLSCNLSLLSSRLPEILKEVIHPVSITSVKIMKTSTQYNNKMWSFWAVQSCRAADCRPDDLVLNGVHYS